MMSNSEARKRAAANEPSADVEALAEVIMASVLVPGPLKFGSHEGLVLSHSEAMRPARAILSSDWLAAHTAAAREKALRDAADALEDHTDCDCEGREEGNHLRHLAAPSWLRDRAAREAARNAGGGAS